jgi:uncharacterized protein (TIGR02466 family)
MADGPCTGAGDRRDGLYGSASDADHSRDPHPTTQDSMTEITADPIPNLLREDAIDIRSFFPTPVVVATLDDHARLDAELARLILARSETHPSVGKSNLGGWQSDTDVQDWAGPAGAAVFDAARRLGDLITAIKEPDGLKRTRIPWRINAWANLNRAGQSNEMHTHAGSYWSGAYYVDDGASGSDPVAGEFEILDPRGVAPLMYAPHLKIAISGCLTAGLSEYLAPRTGQLFLFPAWLFHGVRPYRGTGTRMSIAFNLCL